ncbi:hypothetical protein C8A00DRAFT_44981 [Chaetomidium leptoderma]|uniref:Uncharacterized protein n=1 Tax=Chaetomidium leptoderma TaxID=669021 RepID=A0AAN6VJC2_9PEZI|nr:hypothetical protein C8A00DRAFT_44981 [Chaetomidium leptoderma]
MADADKENQNRPSESDDSDRSSTKVPATAAFSGYRPFSPKLCFATENDLLYLVELHFGYTPRGPLHFGRGFYLRNGTTTKDPILAATGDDPRDTVTEILHASTGKEHSVAFRFAIEVGIKRRQREEFEWRKMGGGGKQAGAYETGSRYTLYRLTSNLSTLSSSSPPLPDDTQVVAELSFRHIMNLKHAFTLELKGAGLTGELGDRWTLMVVMTSLSLHWLRQNGKTKKATVGAA